MKAAFNSLLTVFNSSLNSSHYLPVPKEQTDEDYPGVLTTTKKPNKSI